MDLLKRLLFVLGAGSVFITAILSLLHLAGLQISEEILYGAGFGLLFGALMVCR